MFLYYSTSRCIHAASHTQKGFTLLELLITVVIAGILLTVGIPALTSSVERNRVVAEMRETNNNLAYARSEAVSSNTYVTVCARASNDACGTNWNNGLLVFNDNSTGGRGDGVRSAGEPILRVYDGSNKKNILTAVDITDQRIDSIIFNSRGALYATRTGTAISTRPTRLTFTLCGQQDTSELARALIFEITGRAIPSRDTDGDGIHENAKGVAITC